MDVQSILDKIGEDARASAADILDEARKKAENIRHTSLKHVEQRHLENSQRTTRDGEETEQRMLRMAELEDKKSFLAQKRGVMDAAFEAALDSLKALQPKEAKAYFLRQAALLSDGSEALVAGSNSQDMLDAAFVEEVNKHLSADGKQGGLTLAKGTIPGTGFVLKKAGTEVNCTFEALVDAMRLQSETDIAAILFP